MIFPIRIALLAALGLALAGCGQTGALYLPSDAPPATQDGATDVAPNAAERDEESTQPASESP